MSLVAGIFLVAGSGLAMIGGIGVIRFSDLMSRMHAAAKAPTLGLILVAIGSAIEIGTAAAAATLVLVAVLNLLTTPVATHVLGRAAHGKIDVVVDRGDALAEHRRNQQSAD
jgi:multicomponent Na+:H+ antiporter subunit G